MIYIDHKFIRMLGSQLERFKQKSENLFNFRCPLCGDSEKKVSKARGYVYERKGSLFFKCHNCGVGTTLGNLIKAVDPTLHKAYNLEKFKSKAHTSKAQPDYKFEEPKFDQKKINLSGVGVVPISTLPSDHEAQRFLKKRMLPVHDELYYIDDEEKLEGIVDKYKNRLVGHASRIIIPFYDRHGELIGVTGRVIDNRKKPRYLTLRFTEENGPMIFGLNVVNKNKKVYVVEGPLDALFLPNCVAVSGSDFMKLTQHIDKSKCVIIFDNEPRNKEIIKQMRNVIDNGYKMCIWPENITEKDINEMIVAGRSSKQIQAIINSNTHKGLAAQIAIQNWKRI